jgi:broad specificity phosphatase PhoE
MVSHAGFNSILLGMLSGVGDPHRVKFRQKNACVNHLRIAGGITYVNEINGSAHLTKAAGEAAIP